MDLKYLFLLIFINMIFLFVGGVIYHFIEHPAEEKAIKNSDKNYEELKQELLNNIPCLNEAELEEVIERVINEYDEGRIFVDDSPNWDISGSIFFASTVITTIGYGHISLATTGGRVFSVFYAIMGIPLCLIMLGEIGIRFSKLGQRMDKRLNKGWLPTFGKYVRPVIISVIGFSLFVLIPAAIIAFVEDWNYGTAVYYGIITLTTVGFGDVVAGQNNEKDYAWVYQICLSFWIMFGLAWVANLIANFQELYKGVGEELVEPESDSESRETEEQREAEQTQVSRLNGASNSAKF